MTDPLADMLTRIRNAYLANKKHVDVPHSKLKTAVAHKLKSLGYLESVEDTSLAGHTHLRLALRYQANDPAITQVKRISKPGRRIYVNAHSIPVTLSGHGSIILTTSQGILTDREAKKAGVGGEIICQIW